MYCILVFQPPFQFSCVYLATVYICLCVLCTAFVWIDKIALHEGCCVWHLTLAHNWEGDNWVYPERREGESGNWRPGLLHCNENPIYVFPDKELRGLSPNFHIQRAVVSDIWHLPTIGRGIIGCIQREGRGRTETGGLAVASYTATKIPFIYSQIRNCAASVPISTFMYRWRIYIFPGSVRIFSCSRIGRLIVAMYKSLKHAWMWKLGQRPRNSFSGNICFEFSVLCLCNVASAVRVESGMWRG